MDDVCGMADGRGQRAEEQTGRFRQANNNATMGMFLLEYSVD